MHFRAINTRVFREHEALMPFIIEHLPTLKEDNIVFVTSKIVALSEGRTAPIGSTAEKEALIRSESDMALPTKHVWLTVKAGMFMASAGIDESNANGKQILLPRDSFDAARAVRDALRTHFGLTHLGVVITDSHTMPLRAGVVGVALGYAGFTGLRDYRGSKDIFGRTMNYSTVDVSDSLAAAATLLMGEGNECRPLAVAENAPVTFTDTIDRDELIIAMEDDMYLPLFRELPHA